MRTLLILLGVALIVGFVIDSMEEKPIKTGGNKKPLVLPDKTNAQTMEAIIKKRKDWERTHPHQTYIPELDG